MNIVKDLILAILFLCMLGVLLIFMDFQNELRSMAHQDSVIITSQVKIIETNLIKIYSQENKINELRCESIDLQEVVLRIQRKKNTVDFKLEVASKELKKVTDDNYYLKKTIKNLKEKEKRNTTD